MKINPDEHAVTHNETEHRFEVWINEQLSKLDYIQDKDTFLITQAGLEYAKAKSLRVIPMCSYAASYIRRNPQYASLTKQKENGPLT